MTTPTPGTWDRLADLAQDSLDHWFGAPEPQLLHNNHPAGTGDTTTFNYWWLAHVMDARIDAWARTGDPARLDQAAAVAAHIVRRNEGSLFNDYFDDMLWFALALLRLHRATGDDRHLDDALAIWDHVVAGGWNDAQGTSLAWRTQQLEYKNTPANGPLIILSHRLARALPAGTRDFDRYARTALDWLDRTLVGPDGFVEDGINREGDGRVDTQWRFTYNQGLYVGAQVAAFRADGDPAHLRSAERTALRAVDALSDGTVFPDEGAGGDEGLFKGVYYRYLGELLPLLPDGSPGRERLEAFVRAGTDALRRTAVRPDGWFRPGNDWSAPFDGPIPYSTMLSAIMAVEQRCRLEAGAGSAAQERAGRTTA
jgi:predicted alpha-1,6-mannanase (GH76 family)